MPPTLAKVILGSDTGGGESMDISDFCNEVFNEPSYYDASRVMKLVHYKKPGAVEREFIVGDIWHGETIRQLCMERGRDQAEQQWHDQISRWGTKKKKKRGMWGDSGGSESDDSLLEISILRGREPFPLRELCLILQLNSRLPSQYNVKRYQRFRFCHTILKLLEEELDMVSIQEGKDFDRSCTYRNIVPDEDARAQELRDVEGSDSHDAILKVFQVAMAEKQETKEGSEANTGRTAVEALFSAHNDKHTRATLAAKGALCTIARRVEEKTARDAATEQMSSVNRAFARAETHPTLGAGRLLGSNSWST